MLTRDGALFSSQNSATLCHDDLHHGNVLFRESANGWRLVALLDWDKAWAGPAESDVARMAFWDEMTGPGFWEVYPASHDIDGDAAHRTLIYQLLWCLEYDDGTAPPCRRHHLPPTAANSSVDRSPWAMAQASGRGACRDAPAGRALVLPSSARRMRSRAIHGERVGDLSQGLQAAA